MTGAQQCSRLYDKVKDIPTEKNSSAFFLVVILYLPLFGFLSIPGIFLTCRHAL